MIRAVAAVFVGFVVMAAIVNIPLVLFALKPAAAFKYGTTDVVTTGWMALSIIVAVVAAPCGGYVAAVIARSPTNRPVMALAGIVFMLGILSAIGQLGEMPRQPTWYAFTLPFIVGIGALIGGNLYKKLPRPSRAGRAPS